MLKRLLALSILIPSLAFAGTVTGQIATPTGGLQKNLTITFSLNSPNTVSGSFAVSTSPASCYTDGSGNVVGLPTPLVAPVLSTNTSSGTLGAATYFVKYTWANATGESAPSPENSIVLGATGTVIVNVPVSVPASATSWKLYIASSANAETLQSSVASPFSNYNQASALVGGSALPSSNTSQCSLTFNDQYLAQPNWYTVGVTSPTGATISGISRTGKVYFTGGASGTVNISNGLPDFNGIGIWPTPVLTGPGSSAQQTINGPLSLNGFGLTAGSVTVGSVTDSGLTANRVVKAGAAGLLSNSGITDDGTTETLTENVVATAGQNQLNAFKMNSVLWVDGIKYTTLAGCYADIPSTGGVCMVPPNYSETLGSSLTLSKNNAGFQFMGPALITMGSNQVIVNQSVAGPFIFGQVPTGAVVVTSTDVSGTAGVTFVYTGSGTAFVVGGAAANPVAGLRLENFTIDISGAGTSAIALNLKNVHAGGFVRALNIHGTGPTGAAQSQVGIQADDGGGFTGDITFDTVQIVHVKQGFLFNGASQEMSFLGCQIWGGAASSVAIDMEGAQWGIQFWGGNIDNYTTAVKIASTSDDNYIAMPIGNFTTMANFGASTTRNTVQNLRNVAPVVTDSGTLNNTIWGGTRQGPIINQQGPASAIVGTAADVTLYTYTLPAGMLLPGRGLRITASFLHSTGTTSTTYKLKIGGTTVTSNAYANFATADGNDDTFEIDIFNNSGVQNAQNFFKRGILNLSGQTLMIHAGPVTGTSAIDFTASQVISFTFNVAATDQVTPKFWMVEML